MSPVCLANPSRRLGDLAGAANYLDSVATERGSAESESSFLSTKLAVARGMLEIARGNTAAAQSQFNRAAISPHGMTTPVEIDLGKAEANLLAGDANTAAQDARAGNPSLSTDGAAGIFSRCPALTLASARRFICTS